MTVFTACTYFFTGLVSPPVTAPGPSRLTTVCALLNAAHVRYVVVGGFAVALHGVVRATHDVDVLLEPSVKNVRLALHALEELPFGVAGDLDPATVAASPITVIGDNPRVDVLTLAWSVRYADAAPGALAAEVDGVVIPYADLQTLIRSKRTGRLQDSADIEALERLGTSLASLDGILDTARRVPADLAERHDEHRYQQRRVTLRARKKK